MKAIAKQDMEFNDIIKFIAGQKYKAKVDHLNFMTFISLDDNGLEMCFCGEPKDLEDRFDFVEE